MADDCSKEKKIEGQIWTQHAQKPFYNNIFGWNLCLETLLKFVLSM